MGKMYKNMLRDDNGKSITQICILAAEILPTLSPCLKAGAICNTSFLEFCLLLQLSYKHKLTI